MIFSDSLSALLSLKSIQFNIKTNIFLLEIKRNYQQIVKKDPTLIKIVWIPSHIEISGNKKQTNQQIKKPSCQSIHLITSPSKNTFSELKAEDIFDTNQKLIEQSQVEGSIYFQRYNKFTRKPWFSTKNLLRDLIVLINRGFCSDFSLSFISFSHLVIPQHMFLLDFYQQFKVFLQ